MVQGAGTIAQATCVCLPLRFDTSDTYPLTEPPDPIRLLNPEPLYKSPLEVSKAMYFSGTAILNPQP